MLPRDLCPADNDRFGDAAGFRVLPKEGRLCGQRGFPAQ